jgi:putative RecB family exonuclease
MPFTQPLPKSLSPSRLGDFQACPRRYQYASVERIAQPATYATAKGRFVHFILEGLFRLEPAERSAERARALVPEAIEAVLTSDVREELAMDEAMLARMLREADEIIGNYFSMEDPSAVAPEGVELRLGVTVDGVPLFGILDRLDREGDELVIVDYKTGALPNRDYDARTFANTEIYAALCAAKLGETPSKIRLLYVAHGQAVERPVTEVSLSARRRSARAAWDQIGRYYDAGDFPAKPSVNTCRFCAYKDRCRSSGVRVPT